MTAKLLAGAFLLALLLAAPAQAAPTHYVTMTDGAQIAVNVKVPEQCRAPATCPAYFEMSGYESGSDDGKTPIGDIADATGTSDLPLPFQTGTWAAHAAHVDDRYVTVLANLRGTGCSSGEFDVFSWRAALDGKEVIDNWIANQPWSNGDVVIFGHSYIYPVGHVFGSGHELLVKLHAPPLDDNDYMYVQKTLPGVNTLHFGPDTPSRLMLPLIPAGAVREYTPAAGQCPYVSMRCVAGR